MFINLVQSNAGLKDEKLLVELKPIFYELANLAKNDKWYARRELNPRPQASETCALSN